MKPHDRRFPTVPVLPLAIAALVLFSAVVFAGTPSPSTSTIPTHIVLVGTDANGNADPLGSFSITTRWLNGLPFQRAQVVLDFSRAPDLRICSVQPAGGTTVYCPSPLGPYVRGETGVDGVVNFTIVGCADHARTATHAGTIDIFADGILFGTVPVSAYDHDGSGVGPADQSLFFGEFFSGEYLQRSDFNGDGVIGPADLSLWEMAFFNSGSILGCSAGLCP